MILNCGSFNIPVLKLYTGHCVTYNRFDGSYERHKLDRDNVHRETLSIQSQRKINRIIDFMSDMSSWKRVYDKYSGKHHNFKLGFLTLTLSHSQLTKVGKTAVNLLHGEMMNHVEFRKIPHVYKITDNQIKDVCLNQLLTELRQYHGLQNYLWKAETQENGNIHFHIVIDVFVWKDRINEMWNRIQNKLGIIDEFEKRYHHRQPASTKIHSIKDIGNLKKYFSKYLAKSDERRRSVVGRNWGCNYLMSEYKGIDVMLDNSLFEEEFRRCLELYCPKEYSIKSLNKKTGLNETIAKYYKLHINDIASSDVCRNIVNLYVSKMSELYNLSVSFLEN